MCYIDLDKNLSIDRDKTQCKITDSSESNCISAADVFCRDKHAVNISFLTQVFPAKWSGSGKEKLKY